MARLQLLSAFSVAVVTATDYCSSSSGLNVVVTDTEQTITGLGCSSEAMFDYSDYDAAPRGPYPAAGMSYTLTNELPLKIKSEAKLTFMSSLPQLGSSVGLAVDGTVLLSPPAANGEDAQSGRVYDHCNGHADSIGPRYHYHALPVCLLHSLGGEGMAEEDWPYFTQAQYQDEYDTSDMKAYVEKLIGLFPETGTATLLGYARDGHPMYSPYDEDGNLIKYGSAFQGESSVTYLSTTYEDVGDWVTSLDLCNGAEMNDGTYRYYFTPSPPWTISCYRGKKVSISEDSASADCTCPDEGLCCDEDTTFCPSNPCAPSDSLRLAEGDDSSSDVADVADKFAYMNTYPPCQAETDCGHDEVCQCGGRALLFGHSAGDSAFCRCELLD